MPPEFVTNIDIGVGGLVGICFGAASLYLLRRKNYEAFENEIRSFWYDLRREDKI